MWADAEREHEPGLRACKLFERELRAKYGRNGTDSGVDLPIISINFASDCSGANALAEAWASVSRSMRQLNIAHIEVDQLFASEAPGEHQVRRNCNGPGS